ncbi:hypothetical protein K469DRAFT_601543 [Zopfia rhizophila CBS 207.26]|uniref:Uncharacterized protein n=1 Tax=Zopfia rhizophila CBS 207.26 TaxID=1314779 RepID=A0A6A6DEI6_9PEZI|nr:hypothetical protein K469DRAFT_601543 [Zopfia rhizophila CBS 207.26]
MQEGKDGGFFEPIAVIGLALKFPQDATCPESFWQTLLEKRSALTSVPKERYNADSFENASYGHFIREELGCFHAPFFTISPAEAECMDPQQRWLLETSYHALENSGIPLDQATGSNTSVHIGCFMHDFETMTARDPELPGRYKVTGTSKSILANRLSWFYDFQGPSMVIDTACSSSLIALHMACQSLHGGDTEMGIVAGCNLFYDPSVSANLNSLNFLSPDNKCYSFDHRANGYSRGEGFGVVILKRLSKALQDGNVIRAVIRATGSNQDGRTPGITQPSGRAQELLIRSTYHRAGLDMAKTRYFEAHGTGTPVGDPTEAKAIANAFKQIGSSRKPLYIGSVKSNIGHLEGASGIAGLIKTILVLERGLIPANIWLDRINRQIDAAAWNLVFPTETTVWPTEGLRRASVNSFGFGGTNAHAVLDDAYHYLRAHNLDGLHSTKVTPSHLESTARMSNGLNETILESQRTLVPFSKLLTLSAFDEAGIERLKTAYGRGYPEVRGEHISEYLDDLAYTLGQRRTKLPWRSYAVAAAADTPLSEPAWSDPVRAEKSLNICFVFTGQGAQWRGMGRELLDLEPFKKSLVAADGYFRSLGCHWSLSEKLYETNAADPYFDDPQHSQPICTAIQVALVDLLTTWSITPAVIVGHSSGEIAAAYCSGAISREAAWKISYCRGLAISLANLLCPRSGSMMAVQLSPKRLSAYTSTWHASHSEEDLITVACYNSHSNVRVSGSLEALNFLSSSLQKEGVPFHRLNVDVAYHSPHMAGAAAIYEKFIHDISAGEVRPTRPLISTITGQQSASQELCTADYWVANLVAPVQFNDAMRQVCAPTRRKLGKSMQSLAANYILEIGPHSALKSPIRNILKDFGRDINTCYSSALVRNQLAHHSILKCVGRLQCRGYGVDFVAVNRNHSVLREPKMLTNLPPYPFNRPQNYWLESRISKNYRFRKFPHHELLGTPVMDWNELEARWNNRLILKNMPFLRHHKVNGLDVYPAAGMLVMALEATRQLLGNERKATGYRFKDVTFQNALVLTSDPQGVETQLTLRPSQVMTSKALSSWNEFRICVYENGNWRECCRGAITVEYAETAWSPSGIDEHEGKLTSYNDRLQSGWSQCQVTMHKSDTYRILRSSGLDYGPIFQGLGNIKANDRGEAVGIIDMQHWRSHDPDTPCKPHIVHPSALDAILQLAFPALIGPGGGQVPTMVPTSLTNLWISEDVTQETQFSQIKAHAMSAFKGLREVKASVVAADANSDQICIVAEVTMTIVVTAYPEAHEKGNTCRRFYNLDWRPDFALLKDPLSVETSQSHPSVTNGLISHNMDKEKEWVCRTAIINTLHSISKAYSAPSPHLHKYLDWMRRQVTMGTAGVSWNESVGKFPISQTLEIYQAVKQFDVEGRLLVKIAENLPSMMEGELDPLEFLFSDDLLEKFYQFGQWPANLLPRLGNCVDSMAFKNPSIRIIEVGAGTGGLTASLLDTLNRHAQNESGTSRFAEYVYTDISPGFFVRARERFNNPRISYKTLDISKDPTDQGFDAGSFDVVVASNVLHATPNLEETLKNSRKLLKPGGKLILHESTNPKATKLGFIFGLLPGWWLCTESNREWSPLISQTEWHNLLSRSEFSGADMVLGGDAEEDEENPKVAVMISTALPAHIDAGMTSDITVMYEQSSDSQLEICQSLRQYLAPRSDIKLSCVNIEASQDVNFSKSTCIFLPALDRPFLRTMDSGELALLHIICSKADRLLWVGGQRSDFGMSPDYGIVAGLARTVESENLDFSFVTVTIEIPYHCERVANHIWTILGSNPPRTSPAYENEYAEKNGVLHISRLVEANSLTADAFPTPGSRMTALRKWNGELTRPVKLGIATVGLLDTLAYTEDIATPKPLASEEVEIQVKAAGLNFRDVLTALGQLNDNYFGNELAGVVTQVGSNSTHDLKVGDNVVGVHTGTMKTTVRCMAYQMHKLPSDMPLSTGAALPLVFCTAYYSLISWAQAKPGESVLIHSGAGGFGQASIQLCKYLGCEIYATVSTDEKAQMLVNAYGIPKSHIFSSRNLDFANGIKRLTEDRGVDIILNSLAGEALRKSWGCLAPFGRFIELGKTDIYSTSTSALGGLPIFPLSKNVMFASVDLPQLYERGDRISTILSSVMRLAVDKAITPPKPLHVFKGSEIQQTFRMMQKGKHLGKIVIEFSDDDLVQVEKAKESLQLFDPRSTYMIAGGLGGIAQSICRWMVRRGARNVVLLSRSNACDGHLEPFLTGVRASGANVATMSCDVSNAGQLQSVINGIEKTLPPIKGCIQAAMVLRNVAVNNMTAEDWSAAIRPKVDGSWNLHTLLPEGMDFFILLASQSGLLGAHGQSNYASGNTYQDELARHRVRHGEKAVSIDLGSVTSVGHVADRMDVKALARRNGIEDFSEQDLLALLEYYCDPSLPVQPPLKAQVVTALGIPAELKSKGIVEPQWMAKPLFKPLHSIHPDDHVASAGVDKTKIWEMRLREAKSSTEAEDIVCGAMRTHLADLLAVGEDDIDTGKPVHAYGVDSLVAVELRNWLSKSMAADLPVFEILGNSTIAGLAGEVARKSKLVSFSKNGS